jgi:hypothetical protein
MINQEIQQTIEQLEQERKSFFKDLSPEELSHRKEISCNRIQTQPAANQKSIVDILSDSVKSLDENPKFIPLDFRGYKSVSFQQMSFTYRAEESFNEADLSSTFKHAINVNTSDKGVKIRFGQNMDERDNPSNFKFDPITIEKEGLNKAELVINVSDVRSDDQNQKIVSGILKFEVGGVPPSIIAERVSGLNFDFKEASVIRTKATQEPVEKVADIKLYDVEDTHLTGGKHFAVNIEHIDNSGMTGKLDNYDASNQYSNYYDQDGPLLTVSGEGLSLDSLSLNQ